MEINSGKPLVGIISEEIKRGWIARDLYNGRIGAARKIPWILLPVRRNLLEREIKSNAVN